LIGCFYFTNGPYEGADYYGASIIKLYNFCDLISNWTSLIVFVGLGAAIFGALIKKHKGKLHQTSKRFTVMAYIGMFLIAISLIYEFVANFYDLGSSISFSIQNHSNISDYIIPAILQTVLLVTFTLVIGLSGLNRQKIINKPSMF
jgi:hypothetical protein